MPPSSSPTLQRLATERVIVRKPTLSVLSFHMAARLGACKFCRALLCRVLHLVRNAPGCFLFDQLLRAGFHPGLLRGRHCAENIVKRDRHIVREIYAGNPTLSLTA